MMLSERTQRKTNAACSHLHVESRKVGLPEQSADGVAGLGGGKVLIPGIRQVLGISCTAW